MIPRFWHRNRVLAGPDGSPWRKVLGGASSPCHWRGDLLYVVGATGLRADGGPANRVLGALEVRGDAMLDHGPVISAVKRPGDDDLTEIPSDDPEEGIFGAIPAGPNAVYVSEIVSGGTPGSVDVQTALWTTDDGLVFSRVKTVLRNFGWEIGPLWAHKHGGRFYLACFVKEKPGWPAWSVAIAEGPSLDNLEDLRRVGTLTASTADGPFYHDNRGWVAVVERDGPHTRQVWHSFPVANPRDLRRERPVGLSTQLGLALREGWQAAHLDPDVGDAQAKILLSDTVSPAERVRASLVGLGPELRGETARTQLRRARHRIRRGNLDRAIELLKGLGRGATPWATRIIRNARHELRRLMRQPDDAIDLDAVIYPPPPHAAIGSWPATSKITDARITPESRICVFHTKAGKWPVANPEHDVEGNVWVFGRIDGAWHGTTYEWLRSGQTCKRIEGEFPKHAAKGPLQNWQPRSGEQVGFAVSTHGRNQVRTVNERSNVVVVPWP